MLILAVSLVAVLRPTPVLDPDTPGGVVQQFVQALLDEDHDASSSLVVTSVPLCEGGLGVSPEDGPEDVFLRRTELSYFDSVSVSHRGTEIKGDKATVNVSILVRYSSGPFSGDGGEPTQSRFELVREGGAWRISRAPWPFEFGCR